MEDTVNATGPSSAPGGSLQSAAPDLAALYAEHSRAIHYLCLRLLGDPAKAEDATHDVFLKAWQHLDQFEGRCTWRTWLYRVALNHCRNLKQKWSERHIFPATDDDLAACAAVDHTSPLRVIEIKELGQRIQHTLDRLPHEYRELLLLVADEELSYAAVAGLTGQSTDAVRGKLHRARKLFAAEFPKSA